MGVIVDSCKTHMVCCNTEDKKIVTEPNNFTESVSMSDDDYNEYETEDVNKNVEISNDIENMKVKINDLVVDHQSSPYKYYKPLLTLGSGTYGTVKKVSLIKNPTNIRAMKIISKQNIIKGIAHSKFIDEITILKKLDHPNIMKIYESFVDKDNFYIISDFCDQGDLLGKLEKLGKMNEIVVKFLMDQIFKAVAYLHSKNVLHGDIKLENILLYTASKNKSRRFTSINVDINQIYELRQEINGRSNSVTKRSKNYVTDMMNYEIKLIDFGCSKYFVKQHKHQKLSGIIGSTLYCSPEVVDDLYDEKSDEWSCGVLMYILLCGEPPFQGETDEEIFQKIKKCEYNFNLKEFKSVSENCKDLIRKLLEPKKKKRIKACDALKHPFFTEFFNPSEAMTELKDLNILKKLLQFEKPISKFHEAMHAFICNNFISKDEEKKLRALFRYVDKNDKNALTAEDFQRCFREIKIFLSIKEINEILKLIDSNQNAIIEYQEFLRATCDRNTLLSKDNLKNAFMALTEGGDKAFIDADDIKKFIFHDLNIQDDIFSEYLDQFGMKKDEKIDFEQFCDMLKNNKKLHEDLCEKPKIEEKKNNENNKDTNSEKNNEKNDGKKVLKKVEFKGIQIIEIKEEYESEK
jgi:calcium-dependent protein kinase